MVGGLPTDVDDGMSFESSEESDEDHRDSSREEVSIPPQPPATTAPRPSSPLSEPSASQPEGQRLRPAASCWAGCGATVNGMPSTAATMGIAVGEERTTREAGKQIVYPTEETAGVHAPQHSVKLTKAAHPLADAAAFAGGETPNYYDWESAFPELEVLVQGISDIVDECAQVGQWKAWPEKHYEEGGQQDWKVFPFVHTFPAYDESRRTWVESTCARCPNTASLLRRLPNIRTALFSRLGPGSRIAGHRGWADLANHVLRCHLPLKVPSDGPCGLWVEGEVRHHIEGKMIVFDDSKLHRAFNDSSGDRLVLIVDMLRPSGIPLGTADGEHTPELDAFIDAFR